jgi:hypothetical protein
MTARSFLGRRNHRLSQSVLITFLSGAAHSDFLPTKLSAGVQAGCRGVGGAPDLLSVRLDNHGPRMPPPMSVDVIGVNRGLTQGLRQTAGS